VFNYPRSRLRRNRQFPWQRRLVRESHSGVDDLIWTIVISDDGRPRYPVPGMPDIYRLSVSELIGEARRAVDLGIPAIALFPHIKPEFKDAQASEAFNPEGLVPEAVRAVKSAVPGLGVIVDVALDPYTDHGHDGLMDGGKILNDPTVEALAQGALMLAGAGADIVAPSDMMDGRVGTIREVLDANGYENVSILSYAAKYASAFYDPYRDAIGTATVLEGDKRTYQMDPANSDEALREVELDLREGADMIMVKPGMPYLDIVRRIKDEFAVPTFAFQVSGEYAMLMAASQNGWLDEKRIVMESLLSFKRAGCDGVLTYFAPRVAEWLGEPS